MGKTSCRSWRLWARTYCSPPCAPAWRRWQVGGGRGEPAAPDFTVWHSIVVLAKGMLKGVL
eukprot:scaffold259537_cov10-Tisochrysis_lutea.AAC.1